MRRAAFAWSIAFMLAGCGDTGPYSGKLYPTTGRVILADGRPLTDGSVRFIPKGTGLPATGKLGPDGSFSLTTKMGEGAAPGEYRVRIDPSPEMLSKKGGSGQKLPYAAKYRNYEGDTGLTATIASAPTQLEPFRLESK